MTLTISILPLLLLLNTVISSLPIFNCTYPSFANIIFLLFLTGIWIGLKKIKGQNNKFNLAFLLFISFSILISISTGTSIETSLGHNTILLIGYLFYNEVTAKTDQQKIKFLRTLNYSYAITLLLDHLLSPLYGTIPLIVTLGNINYLINAYSVVCLPCLILEITKYTSTTRNFIPTTLSIICFCIFTYYIVDTSRNGATLGLIFGAGTITLSIIKRFNPKLFYILALSLMLIFIGILSHLFLNEKNNSLSNDNRTLIYGANLDVWIDSPLYGHGNMAALKANKLDTPSSEALDLSDTWNTHPHNEVINILQSSGIIGLSLFLLALIIHLKLIRSNPYKPIRFFAYSSSAIMFVHGMTSIAFGIPAVILLTSSVIGIGHKAINNNINQSKFNKQLTRITLTLLGITFIVLSSKEIGQLQINAQTYKDERILYHLNNTNHLNSYMSMIKPVIDICERQHALTPQIIEKWHQKYSLTTGSQWYFGKYYAAQGDLEKCLYWFFQDRRIQLDRVEFYHVLATYLRTMPNEDKFKEIITPRLLRRIPLAVSPYQFDNISTEVKCQNFNDLAEITLAINWFINVKNDPKSALELALIAHISYPRCTIINFMILKLIPQIKPNEINRLIFNSKHLPLFIKRKPKLALTCLETASHLQPGYPILISIFKKSAIGMKTLKEFNEGKAPIEDKSAIENPLRLELLQSFSKLNNK